MANTKIVHGNHKELGETDGYAYCCRNSAGYTMTSHIHSNYEYVYITEGQCVYIIEGQEYIVSPGDIVFTRPGELHSFSFPEECRFTRQFLHVYPDCVKDIPGMDKIIAALPKEFHYIPSKSVHELGIDEIFKDLKIYSEQSEPETTVMAYACILRLTAVLSKHFKRLSEIPSPPAPNKNVYKIMQYVDKNYTKTLMLNEIADSVHLTPVHVSRLFRAETGMTLTTYINLKRIVLAKNLIEDGEQITLVSRKCGFDNYSTFYRKFTKLAGMSPKQFSENKATYIK